MCDRQIILIFCWSMWSLGEGNNSSKYLSSTEDKFGNLHKESDLSFPIFEFQIYLSQIWLQLDPKVLAEELNCFYFNEKRFVSLYQTDEQRGLWVSFATTGCLIMDQSFVPLAHWLIWWILGILLASMRIKKKWNGGWGAKQLIYHKLYHKCE